MGGHSGRERFHQRHPWLTRAGLALVALAAADLVAGAFLIDRSRLGFRRPHPYYHHDLVPGRAAQAQWGPRPPYPVFTNSLGFLDREVRQVPLQPEGRRVVLIGDSFTEGIGLPFEQTFAGLLQAELAASGTEVLNAAVLSYAPHLYYLKVRYLIEQVGLELDELCVMLDISDIQDEVLYRRFTPQLPTAGRELGLRLRRLAQARSLLFYTIDDVVNARARRKRRAEYDAEHYPPWLDYFWMDNQDYEPYSDPDFLAIRTDWTTEALLGSRWTQEGLELARRHMDALLELCRQHGIELTLAVYPWPQQITRLERASPQVTIWREYCQQNSIPFVDLFADFVPETRAQAAGVYARCFIQGDVHWNPQGHRLVAQRLAPLLAQ